MTQTAKYHDPTYAQAEQDADLASQLLVSAYQSEGYRRQRLVEEAKILVAKVQNWITPESPQEAHVAVKELSSLIAQFEASKPN
jgi:hypothetical protein